MTPEIIPENNLTTLSHGVGLSVQTTQPPTNQRGTTMLKSTGIILPTGKIVYTNESGKLVTILADGKTRKSLTPSEIDTFLKIRSALANW